MILFLLVLTALIGCLNKKADENTTASDIKKNAKDSIPRIINENLKFTKSQCSSGSYNKEEIGKIKSKWDKDILNIESLVVTNCAVADVQGDFEVNGNELILKCYVTLDGIAKCECSFKVFYSISNLKKKDYKISLKEETKNLQNFD